MIDIIQKAEKAVPIAFDWVSKAYNLCKIAIKYGIYMYVCQHVDS